MSLYGVFTQKRIHEIMVKWKILGCKVVWHARMKLITSYMNGPNTIFLRFWCQSRGTKMLLRLLQ